VIDFGGFTILLDPKSTIYLKGITLDFNDGLQGRGFVFGNPNATNTCGCGESFSV
jgi:iron-sulfur cluster assembly protein